MLGAGITHGHEISRLHAIFQLKPLSLIYRNIFTREEVVKVLSCRERPLHVDHRDVLAVLPTSSTGAKGRQNSRSKPTKEYNERPQVYKEGLYEVTALSDAVLLSLPSSMSVSAIARK